MSNLKLNLIKFNSKKNEVILDKEIINWRKQKATLAKKKNISAIDYINQNYGNDINNGNGGVIFAYFDYNNDSTIYLMYSSNTNDNIDNIDIKDTKNKNKSKKHILKTNLYFDLYIPSINSVEIIADSCDIENTDEKIIVYGKVYGLCIDNNTYYFKNININEYIEFVQRNNEQDLSTLVHKYDEDNEEKDEEENKEENKKDKDDDEDEDEDEDEDDINNEDEDDINNEDDDDINNEDDDDDDDEDDNINNEEDDDEEDDDDDEEDDESAVIDIDDDVDDVDVDDELDDADDAEDDADDDEEEVDEAEDKDNDTEAVDDEELICDGDGDGGDLVNLDIEDETINKSKRKKRTTKNNKLVKTINMDDLNIIFNVLKEESIDNNMITLEKDLFIKRSQSINILKTLNLPLKTIQLIEKGIYNYSINKCILRQTIPIWENCEFVDIYINKTKNIYLNLNTVSYVKNIYLIEKVKKNEINPYDLAFMDSYKLFPEVWSEIIDEKTKTAKMLRDSLEESATDMFSCPRCHKRKTIYCEVQTRSSDEPMTTFITCLECGKKWKKY